MNRRARRNSEPSPIRPNFVRSFFTRTVDAPVVLHPSADFELELAVGRVEPQAALPVRGQEVFLIDALFDFFDLFRQARTDLCRGGRLLVLGLGLNHQIAVLLLADLPVSLQNIKNFCGYIFCLAPVVP